MTRARKPDIAAMSAILLLALSACHDRQTETPTPAKAAACGACHPRNGQHMAPLFPLLAGQNAPYLAAQLHTFRDGSRHDPIMNAMARDLSDDEIEALSRYYEGLNQDATGVDRGGRTLHKSVIARPQSGRGDPDTPSAQRAAGLLRRPAASSQ